MKITESTRLPLQSVVNDIIATRIVMPIVNISLVQGRDKDVIKRCIKEVARTVHETLGAPLASIRVLVHEVPAAYWAIGDETRDEIDAAKAAASAASHMAKGGTPT